MRTMSTGLRTCHIWYADLLLDLTALADPLCIAVQSRRAARHTHPVQHCACYATRQRRHEVHRGAGIYLPPCESCCCKYPETPELVTMLTNHQDNSQCPGLWVRSGRNALRSLYRDHSSSCSCSDAALFEAHAVHAVDSEAIVQVIHGKCLSRVSTAYSLDANARIVPSVCDQTVLSY